MKIIKHSKKKEKWPKVGECGRCGCVFEASKKDAKYFQDPRQDHSGYHCGCPECAKFVWLD